MDRKLHPDDEGNTGGGRRSIASADDFARADGFIVLDTAKKKRCNVGADLKQTDWSAGRPVINIDHHESNTRFGDINWIVGDAGSTCELVFYLLRAAGVPITPAVASLLYAGIQTDTLGFSLPSTTAAALHAAAFLVESGADVARLGERLGRSQRKSEFDLLRVVYANTKIVGEGDIAYSFAGYDEIHDAGCTAADIDDQISHVTQQPPSRSNDDAPLSTTINRMGSLNSHDDGNTFFKLRWLARLNDGRWIRSPIRFQPAIGAQLHDRKYAMANAGWNQIRGPHSDRKVKRSSQTVCRSSDRVTAREISQLADPLYDFITFGIARSFK
ncbi:MAG: DHH family phosphoesterase [Planctomycetes bacterium]|nr:DHH family phosphoesterase [Planctomycetota bacterium]